MMVDCIMAAFCSLIVLGLASIPVFFLIASREDHIKHAYKALKGGDKLTILQSLDTDFLMSKPVRKLLQTKLKEIELEELDAQILALPPKR